MLWIISISVLLVFLLVLYYFGILTPIRIDYNGKRFGPRKYLYFNQACSYMKCGPEWGKVWEAVNENFKLSYPAGIYYDPIELVDENEKEKCRITFGVIVNPGEENKINAFLKSNPQYQETTLPLTEVVRVSYPYRNPLSFLFAVKKVYPNLTKFIQEKQLNVQCIMETYDLNQYKKIQFLAFYGEKAQEYVLTTLPAPSYKKTD